MRLVIIHDSLGNVLGLTASPPDGPVAYPETKPGYQVTLVDAPDMTVLSPEQIHERLSDLVEHYKIDMSGSRATLIKK